MASTSGSSIQNNFKYDVFLSFRGEDTRKTFVDHLYHALKQKSIETYKDDEKIKQGKMISDELIKAIEDSKFYIIVFSKNYASSSWCLEELVKIMECRKGFGHTAYPVFYDLEPSEVRKQSGSVKDAFAKHKEDEAAGKWREALKEASDLAGWELKSIANGHEAKVIQKIVQEISLELRSINFGLDEKLVGMETRVKDVVSYLETSVGDVRMLGIWGMGGAGKTTLARAVFDQISFKFEGQSFVENVREESKPSLSGLKSLQKQVLSDISNDQGVTVSGVLDGKNKMKKMMRDRKVLVVLDDVDHKDQLEALAGDCNWFKPGSRIIITTREKQVLVAHGVRLVRNVTLLSKVETGCLFGRYAFGREIPTRGYEELSGQVVQYAHGLPLTLKVLGSFLCGQSEPYWIDVIERLKTIPLEATMKRLEISFDGLENDYKEIFLDVACILKGWVKKEAIRALESRGFHAEVGLRVLEQKSLITYNEEKYVGLRLGMHDHLEEMGRNIVRRSHPDEPQRHSRLWVNEEIEYILTNDLGTPATKCLYLQSSWGLSAEIAVKGLAKMKDLRFLRIYLLDDDEESNIVEFDKVSEYLPSSLRFMRWFGFPFLSLPNTFQGKYLVGLVLDYSDIVQLWEDGEEKVLNNLRFLDIRWSKLRTFDLSLAPNLEQLDIYKCYDLVELHIPADHHSKLEYLTITYSKLTNLHLGNTPNLEKLILKNCYYLVELLMPAESLKLEDLDLSHSKLKSLHLGNTPSLKKLILVGCNHLVELKVPNLKLQYFELRHSKLKTLHLGNTPNLERLRLKGCTDLVELQLPAESLKLEWVDLSHSKLKNLHLGSTPNLKKLILEGCNDLVELQMPAESLKLEDLDLSHSKLKSLHLGNTPSLKKLILKGCNDLVELQMPAESLKLEYLELRHSKLKTIHLGITPNLTKLSLEDCSVELHIPESLELRFLNFSHSNLRVLHLGITPNLEELSLRDCHYLVKLRMPAESLKLKSLDLSYSKLRTLYLGFTPNLETLSLSDCHFLVELHLPAKSLKLKSLTLSHSKLKTLFLGATPNLETLSLKNNDDLVELHMPTESLKLQSLYLSHSKLRSLNLGITPNLEMLSLKYCHDLQELQMPAQSLDLRFLELSHSKLTVLHLGFTPNLEKLSLIDCHYLVELRMPAESLKLKSLDFSHSKFRVLILGFTPNLDTLSLTDCHFLNELHLPAKSRKLKSDDLSHSELRTIYLGVTPNLEKLSLKYIHDLVELHMPGESLKLKSLHLNHSKLRSLNLGITPNLETLSLKNCHDLVELQMPAESLKLKSLDLGQLKLRVLHLENTPNLETLSLIDCHELVELHMPAESLKLKYLNLSHSKLRTFHLRITPVLETLRVQYCYDLVELQMPAESLSLIYFDLSHSKLTALHLGITPNLEMLSLRECHDLVELHMPTQCLKLVSLDLIDLKLMTLDMGLTPNLETLRIASCDMVDLHMSVSCLNLRSLNLSRSKLRTFNLGMIPNIQRLSLKDCLYLVEISAPVGCLKKLVYLDISNCGRFECFLFDKRSQSVEVGSLSELHLIANPIDVCPLHSDNSFPKFQISCYYKEDQASLFGNLEKLISFGLCACTNLESLSGSICDLQNIRKFTLEGSIPELPKDLHQLNGLEELILLSTKIKHLPESICMQRCLKSLKLKSCLQLEKLPEDLGRLQCLEELDLTECIALRDIPNSICQMKSLKYFHLPYCFLVEKLPEEIGSLKRLEELNIEGTGISHLPQSIFQLKRLRIVGFTWQLQSYGFRSVIQTSTYVSFAYTSYHSSANHLEKPVFDFAWQRQSYVRRPLTGKQSAHKGD